MKDYAAERYNAAAKQVAIINEVLQDFDVQFCVYAARHIVKKGSVMVLESDCAMRVNGRGPAFLFGSFAAYKYI